MENKHNSYHFRTFKYADQLRFSSLALSTSIPQETDIELRMKIGEGQVGEVYQVIEDEQKLPDPAQFVFMFAGNVGEKKSRELKYRQLE